MRYANCPGESCVAKVKVIEVVPEPEINFCCLPCFEYTWHHMFSEDGGAADLAAARGHSGQCWDRQADRFDEPVVEGDFKIHSPRSAPPSRLGGNGGQAV